MSNNATPSLGQAFNHIKLSTKREDFKLSGINVLLNEGVEKKFETNQKEAAIFAHGGCNLLEAEAQKLGSEDGKQVRCDLQMKSLALAHFSESGKSGCN